MAVDRTSILGNDYIGALATATDAFFLLGKGASEDEQRSIAKTLGVECVRASVAGSNLIGIYTVANSKGVLLPYGTEDNELEAVRKALPGARVEIFKTEYNALKNNILANDSIAVINPDYGREEESVIARVLGVRTVRASIAGFRTVGATNILTNKGMVVNNRASEDEKRGLEALTGTGSEQSTANLGSVYVGLCAIANSNGVIAGSETTGFELAHIVEGLGL